MARRIPPVARLFFPCDEADWSSKLNAWVLTHPRHTAALPPGATFPFRATRLWLYAQLTGGVGAFNLSVQFSDYASGVILGRTRPEYRTYPGGQQWRIAEEVFEVTNLPFPRPEVYVFHLMANFTRIKGGTAYLRVL